MAAATTLLELPDTLLLNICAFVGSKELARLECTTAHFRRARGELLDGDNSASLAECAAELAISSNAEGWRVSRRPGEPCKYLLFVLEHLLAPLPVVASGTWHTMVVRGTGMLVTFGSDQYRQLGIGKSDKVIEENPDEREDECLSSPHGVVHLGGESVVSVAACVLHSACITGQGCLRTWGCAEDGRLGLGPSRDAARDRAVAAPRSVMSGFPLRTRVSMVAAGDAHTACITAAGELFTWGYACGGQLGHGDETEQPTPRLVSALRQHRMVDVDTGQTSTAVVTVVGQLYMCGNLITAGGGGREWHDAHHPELISFPDRARVRRVACGDRHFAAVGMDGTLYTWGDGEWGKLGHGSLEHIDVPRTINPAVFGESSQAEQRAIASVSCAEWHMGVLTANGQLWTWGWGNSGRLGHGDDQSRHVPTLVAALETSSALRLSQPVGFVPRDLSCGAAHTVVAMANGAVCTFGRGGAGQLGLNEMKDEHAPKLCLLP